MATSKYKDLKLNSPAGLEPMAYGWPLQHGSGADRHDSGVEILETIRWVCEDMPEIKTALDDVHMHEVDTGDYESMNDVCELYNRAIDSVFALVSRRTVANPQMISTAGTRP